MQALFLGAAVLASAATAAPVSESAGVATTEISGIGCNVFFNGDGLLATSTTDECNPVATALNKLDGVSNVTCHYIDSMQPHYDHVFGAGTKENCDATARALNKLNATLEVGCVADYPNPGLFLAVHVGGGVFQCTAAAARLTAILQAGDTVCKDTEFCCPAAKRCLTPTEMCWPPGCTLESCSSDAECGRGNVCCPLTKICVTPGAACASPCADQGSYCCPDAKHCLTPTNPGVFCADDASCTRDEVCCPLTKLCVKVGEVCTPPLKPAFMQI